MTYFESAEGEQITRARALREVAKHGADAADFLDEMGDRASYDAQSVLEWLGY